MLLQEVSDIIQYTVLTTSALDGHEPSAKLITDSLTISIIKPFFCYFVHVVHLAL